MTKKLNLSHTNRTDTELEKLITEKLNQRYIQRNKKLATAYNIEHSQNNHITIPL